ncbi:hypothetical protein [Acidovorax temperans]|uniref:hypothetical protein n=1 Tax=Acidovorax temperans TaxID=80878 RepID=UPI0035B287BB
MPVLDKTHLTSRLIKRISELESGHEVAKRDIYAVLNAHQQQELESALVSMQALKKQSKARTTEAKKALGLKTIREIRIEVLKRALAKAKESESDAWTDRQRAAEVRRSHIYLKAFFEARTAGKTSHTANTWANNALTRAGLSRMDGRIIGDATARDKAVRELEQSILQRERSEMSPDELEQIELLELHRKEVDARRKAKRGKSK